MTTDNFIAGFFIVFLVICYYKRHKTPFKQIWDCVVLFGIILLAFLAFGYIKDQFKKN